MAPGASEEEQGEEVEMVPASPVPDPEQQQGRAVTAHQDYSEEEAAAAEMIKEFLSELQAHRARISQLLRPAGPHGAVTGDAGRWRCLDFMDTELSIIAAFWMSRQYYLDVKTEEWLRCSVKFIIPLLANAVISDFDDPSRHTLLQRASRCFHRRKSCSYVLLYYVVELYYFGQHPSRDMHLQTSSDDLGLTPQLSEAESGAHSLVGIHRPAKKILRWFALAHQGKMDMNRRVVSIVGPVGIGKTTLAVELRNRLRQHETSGGRYYFQCNIMAQASKGTDRNICLLQDILSQVSADATALSSDLSQAKTMELLVHLVSENLRDKRYLVIMDDIREASDWEKLKGAFPNNNLGSRILVTTRSTSTAWACCSDSYDGLVHEMKPLCEMDSERLLLAKAVGSMNGSLPNNMKLLCDEILRRCDGIPLFIIGMADWLKERRLAMHYEEQVPWLPEGLEQVLSSAFNDFRNDDYLWLILLSMSIFPYGYKFEKDRLIFKWIDEGLCHYSDGTWKFGDVNKAKSKAEKLFSLLVDRNVITCIASNCKHRQDEAEACHWQINHFMQQFLASKSADMGFVFTTTTLKLLAASSATTTTTTTECGTQTSSRMPRRLALHHPDPLLPSLLETMNLSQTRSLYVSGTVNRISLDKFVNLVVLDLEGWENLKDDDLVQVCRSQMFFLKYLNVRNTRVSKLPHEIKELQILQTLDVSYTEITELPFEMFEMSRLLHLDLRGTRIKQLPNQIVGLRDTLRDLFVGGEGSMETATRLPHDVRHLMWLNTLATVDLTKHPASFVRALGDLQFLHVLAVIWSFHQSTDRDYCEALLSSIRNWKYLYSLTIHCGLGCSMEFLGSLGRSRAPQWLEKFKVTAGRFASVPPWIHGLEYLAFVQITICYKQTMTGDLKILGALPKLQRLILGLDFIPVQAIEIGNEGFRELQRFSVDCPKPWLIFRAGAMWKLTYLQLKLCTFPASNTEVPSGIGDLPSLTEVALCYNPWDMLSSNINKIVGSIREAIAEHPNQIDLFINGIKDYNVQTVDDVREISTGSPQRTAGGTRDDAQAVDKEATRVVQTEITEAES